MKVITVHGIRRKNKWYDEFEQIEEIKNENIQVLIFDYGYFSFWEFLSSKRREEIIDNFCKFYSKEITDTNNPPCVIAHSFGTYIVYMAMKRYSGIKFKGIIFCGSILSTESELDAFFSNNQISTILNDHGKREWYLKFTGFINKNFGEAGRLGFLNISPKYKSQIENRSHFLRHSDYFLPLHMKQNWLPFLKRHKYHADYDKKILRDQIIDRIYLNIQNNKYSFDINEIAFFARIDKAGNYYAKYEIRGINSQNYSIDNFTFSTTADGLNKEDDMNFTVYDDQMHKLEYEFVDDKTHLKTIKAHFNKPISPKQSISFRTYFCWHGTIDLRGDTDHWSIKDIRNVDVNINFPSELKSPRIYIIKDREIIGRLDLTFISEKDGSITYNLKYINKDNVDGLVFYFEGNKVSQNGGRNFIQNKIELKKIDNPKLKALTVYKKTDYDFTIQRAALADLKKIYKLELDIEYGNAASEETLKGRINMFNDGFLIIKNFKDEVVGYIESIIWNEKPFETFKEISNFPMHYNIKGDSLYIIFLAVNNKYRKRGLGKTLLKEIELVAKFYEIKKIRLVAKDGLVDFYSKEGYTRVKLLPDFLKGRNYKSILMEKIII